MKKEQMFTCKKEIAIPHSEICEKLKYIITYSLVSIVITYHSVKASIY